MGELIDEDTPLTLAEACETIFRDTITPATLRAEAARGNLVIERIGRRDFVTARAIRDMRVKCRVDPKAPASISTQKSESGLSETERANVALAAAKMSAKKLKRPSLPSSPRNTSPSATIVPIGSASRMS
ncbi:hypothetical protein [Xanthobacter sp. VNH20]|uniref:hypothetical protein n=1 Tax=Xanthobacter sp. VNH20 TaxID=3156616 RepID=UPI0032B3F873